VEEWSSVGDKEQSSRVGEKTSRRVVKETRKESRQAGQSAGGGQRERVADHQASSESGC